MSDEFEAKPPIRKRDPARPGDMGKFVPEGEDRRMDAPCRMRIEDIANGITKSHEEFREAWIKKVGDLDDRYRAVARSLAIGGMLFFLAVTVGGFLLYQALEDETAEQAQASADRVAEVERADRDQNRVTAYRLCSRNTVDRAFAHSRVRMSAGRAAVAELEKTTSLPILDCKPNLRGRGAKVLLPREQRVFVRRWEQGKLSAEERGICPRAVFGGSTKC
jgi:hypothetical protein